MRNISFSLTTPQFLARTKTVTRRLGWTKLQPGDQLQAVEKCMGLKLGEKMRRLGLIEVVDVRRERLKAITLADVEREGFPGMSVSDFVRMFTASHPSTDRNSMVTRIEFIYLD